MSFVTLLTFVMLSLFIAVTLRRPNPTLNLTPTPSPSPTPYLDVRLLEQLLGVG